jgi:integrase
MIWKHLVRCIERERRAWLKFLFAWKRLLNRSEIQSLHFHDLRHEAISRFFEMGLSVPEVALISGHRDYRMLARYTHLRTEDVAKKLLGQESVKDFTSNQYNATMKTLIGI